MAKDLHIPVTLRGNRLEAKASLGQTVIVTEGPETYTGPVTVTPSELQQTLQTADKMLINNVTVEPIPSEYIVPTGTETITVTENGTVSRDVTDKASVTVNVDVPVPVPTVSVYSGSFTPSEDTLGPSFDIGGSNFSHFLVFASTDVDRIQNKKAFVVCYTEFGDKDVFSITTNNSGALTTPRYLTDKWFVKDGQTVICTNRGASNGGNTGYWLGGVTYNWFAW